MFMPKLWMVKIARIILLREQKTPCHQANFIAYEFSDNGCDLFYQNFPENNYMKTGW